MVQTRSWSHRNNLTKSRSGKTWDENFQARQTLKREDNKKMKPRNGRGLVHTFRIEGGVHLYICSG